MKLDETFESLVRRPNNKLLLMSQLLQRQKITLAKSQNVAENQCDQIGQNLAVWLLFARAIFTFSAK
jgi:hypothetical protein